VAQGGSVADRCGPAQRRADDLATHFGFIVLSILHNLVDIVLSLTIISFFSGWNIPYITQYLVPYLQNEPVIFGAGIFLIAGNVFWLVVYPFTN